MKGSFESHRQTTTPISVLHNRVTDGENIGELFLMVGKVLSNVPFPPQASLFSIITSTCMGRISRTKTFAVSCTTGAVAFVETKYDKLTTGSILEFKTTRMNSSRAKLSTVITRKSSSKVSTSTFLEAYIQRKTVRSYGTKKSLCKEKSSTASARSQSSWNKSFTNLRTKSRSNITEK